MFCLPKKQVDALVEKIKSGEITPEKLSTMTSETRRNFLKEFLGEENAKKTNALLESKLILKDQQRGLVTAIKQLLGQKPTLEKDALATVNRMTDILKPKEVETFLEDLVEKRLGMSVSMSEASKLVELAKMVAEKKDAMASGGDRMDYGMAKVAFSVYFNQLKLAAQKMTPMEYVKNPTEILSDIAGTAKSIKASLDNSAIFRQGWKVLLTHPGLWLKRAKQSFSDIWKTLGGKEVMDSVNADILSRPNAVNGNYKKGGFDIGTIEEAYPTSLPQRIPIIGRIYKASEAAYTAFLHRLRADLADKYIEIAQKSGVDITNVAELQSIGKLVNSLTGRGSLGKAEPIAGMVNNVFFSPRLLKSNWDILTAHQLQRGVTPFVRKQAAINLLKIVGGTAAVLTLADALMPGSVEKDPRSTDFGKIKVGDTRFDVTGGMGSLVTLAFRQMLNSSKSSSTGLVSPLGTGEYGSMDRLDVLYNFFENKLSPAGSVTKDLITGQTFEGNKPTVIGELNNLLTPMIISNYVELQKNPNSANIVMSEILDALGISVNTYSASAKDWTQNPGAELQSFQKKIGETRFKEANDMYNQKLNEWFSVVGQDIRYKSLPEEDKTKVITKKKNDIKDSVFRYYGFHYNPPPTKKLPKL
jgi:hypothetical protein